jgi:phosphoserine aminotransferase
MKRVYNFNAGPSAMPLDVLKAVQAEFLDFNHTGMSIVEISHRSAAYQDMQDETVGIMRRLLQVPDDYHIVFMQGGGSLQFAMHAMNFLKRRGGYLNTGVWSDKAMKAASFFGDVYEVASSKADGFSYIPKADTFVVQPDTDYVYMTSNNTIHGTEWHGYPSFDVPLFCDMSSDFMSQPVDVSKFDFIYAGAQKNIGPAGVVVAIIKDSLLAQAKEDVPVVLQYKTYVEHDSTYNTPPVFGIYFINKVMHWLEDNGGLEGAYRRNVQKAGIVYAAIDGSDGFYRGHAAADSRSLMNVTFNLPTAELEGAFVAQAAERGLIGLKGHRSLGGCRASIYNAVTEEGCRALAEFMEEFRKNH